MTSHLGSLVAFTNTCTLSSTEVGRQDVLKSLLQAAFTVLPILMNGNKTVISKKCVKICLKCERSTGQEL